MYTYDLLDLRELLFREMDKLHESGQKEAVYELIDMAEPPSEWVIELPSKIESGTSYKTLPLGLMEAALRRIFGYPTRVSDTSLTITQDKGRFAVTAVVKYSLPAENLVGVATVYTSDISMLELASPQAVSMAVKNAIKQLGGLFGKYLNRNEQAEFSIEDVPSINIEEKIESLEDCINACKTIDELKTYRRIVNSTSISPHIQGIYEAKLRELKSTKND